MIQVIDSRKKILAGISIKNASPYLLSVFLFPVWLFFRSIAIEAISFDQAFCFVLFFLSIGERGKNDGSQYVPCNQSVSGSKGSTNQTKVQILDHRQATRKVIIRRPFTLASKTKREE